MKGQSLSMQQQGKVVREYLSRNLKMSKRQLAKVIYKENKFLYKNEESVRSAIRYHTGATGDESRTQLVGKEFADNNYKKYNRVGKYKLAESDSKEYLPYVIPSKYKRGIIFSDVHIPYHSPPAIEIMFDHALKKSVDFIIINGDLIDMYQLSRFTRDPKMRSFEEELDKTKMFLETLKKVFPKADIYIKEGNHEQRYEDFLKANASEIYGMPEFKLDVILSLFANRIKWINKKRVIQIGQLSIIHGHEYMRSIMSPVNPARGLFMKAKASSLMGHNHQTSEHTESNIHGKITTCWSIGCLCDLHPEYARINKWNHGFAEVEFEEDYYMIYNKRIVNNRVV